MADGWFVIVPNGDGTGEKQVNPEAVEKSVVVTPEAQPGSPPSLETTLLWFVAQAASEITQWGSNPKLRDKQLRAFWPTESYFASGLGTVCARNAAFSWAVEGPPRLARYATEILHSANQGKGWQNLATKTSIDLYTQDYGAFWELVRSSDGPKAPVIGINHLDAERCWHTRDPLKPVVYQDTLGVYHLLPYHNVVTFSELPMPHEKFNGLQFCTLSRLLRASEIIKNITIYEQEKTGGRFQRALHLIKGITTEQINEAQAQVVNMADQMGALRYVQPTMVGSIDPKADVGHDTIELAQMIDNFSKEDSIKIYITIMAMAFLSDYQDFAPLPGGNLGTSQQSQILHMKSRGRGPALWMGLISQALNFRVFPKLVQFGFDEQDLEADKDQADIRKTRADTFKILVTDTGILTVEAARQIAFDRGDIPKDVFESMGAVDETPVEVVTEEEKPEVAEQPEVERISEEQKAEGGGPARAGPFRSGEGEEGEKATCCGSEGSCCYSEAGESAAPP